MERLLAKCGCDCSTCPTYKENLKTIQDRERCSQGWEKYLDIKLRPEKLRLCDGCAIPDSDRKVFYLNCRVRKCAMLNGVENCAYCSAYPCQDVMNIHSIQKPNAREEIQARIGYRLPQNDYLSIVEPYEGLKHLDEIRRSLKSNDIVQMVPLSKTPKVIPFPEKISVSPKEIPAYQLIHRIISVIEVEDNVSYARSAELAKNRKHLLKLLWAFGVFGEIEKHGKVLTLGSEFYSAQKITAYFTKLEDYILILKKHDLNCEISPVANKTWKTEMGALRHNGWYLKMRSNAKDGVQMLPALKNYAMALEEKYDKNAFRYFVKADMRVLRFLRMRLPQTALVRDREAPAGTRQSRATRSSPD